MVLHCYFKDEIGHIAQDVLTITTQSSFLFERKNETGYTEQLDTTHSCTTCQRSIGLYIEDPQFSRMQSPVVAPSSTVSMYSVFLVLFKIAH